MLTQAEFFKPVQLDSFQQGRIDLYNKYKNYFNINKVSAGPLMTWNKENFLGIFEEIDNAAKERNVTVTRTRFFITPKGQSLGVHTDGLKLDDYAYALNIPIIFGDTDHWMNWFRYTGEVGVEESSTYSNAIRPKDPSKLTIADRLTMLTPHYVKIGVFHSVNNFSDRERIILSIRFSDYYD
jgi:hypothetical protein